MRGDGSLAFGNHGRSESNAHGAAGERAPRVGPFAETSRDRKRDRQRFARVRECPLSREGILGRGSRPIFTEGR